jgi:PAS domain S-box-containing protein
MQTLIYGADSAMRAALRRVLAARGHDVHLAADSDAALDAFRAEGPRLVVLSEVTDASLALCRRLRAETRAAHDADPPHLALPSPVIVAVFDDASRERLQEVFDAGADDCVTGTASAARLNTRFAFVEHHMHARDATQARQTSAQEEAREAAVQREAAAEEATERLEARIRQQAIVAEIGRRALAGAELDVLFTYTARAVADALDVDFCKVMEHRPDAPLPPEADAEACDPADRLVDDHGEAGDLVVRASVGWSTPYRGLATACACGCSQAGYTLRTGEAMLVEDFAKEKRFEVPGVPGDEEVVSGLTVLVGGGAQPWGVLGAYATERRLFTGDDVHFLRSVANALASAVERDRAEAALRESEAKAHAILNTTVDGVITIDARGRITSFNPAAEAIFGYDEDEIVGENVKLLMPDPYREEHDGYIRSYHTTGRRRIIGIGREVTGLRKDGSTFPMDLAVSEVRLDDRILFTGIVRDITERRRLEQELLSVTEQERRRIGQDLHDGLGQMLTGLGLLSQNLARQLEKKGIEQAEDAAEITELLREADQYARDLARGLTPVDLDASGLLTALQRLANNAERLFGLECDFKASGEPLVHDSTAATHMYRIAQEAVSNAVRHGGAHALDIALAAGQDHIRLRIQDDGEGFAPGEHDGPGMGMRIMNYRARIIGGTLEVHSQPGHGTTITCTLPRTAYASGDGDGEALAEA